MSAIGPREQLVDVAVGMSVDDPRQDAREIGKRIGVVDLAGEILRFILGYFPMPWLALMMRNIRHLVRSRTYVPTAED